jgi:hypothetical protein
MESSSFSKDVSLPVVQSLYGAAEECRKLKPWDLLDDSQMFGVRSKHIPETLYCCVMGAAKFAYGLVMYRGSDGLNMFLDLQLGLVDESDVDAVKMHHALTLEFAPKQKVSEADLRLAQQLNFQFSGKNSWPVFQSFLPEHAPWALEENEALAITEALEALRLHVEAVQDKSIDIEEVRESEILVYQKKGATWLSKWEAVEKLSREPLGGVSIVPEPLDESLLKKLQEKKLKKNSVWEAAFFFMPTAVVTSGRPFYPKVCALVEDGTAHCIGVEVLEPSQDPVGITTNLILRQIEKLDYLPKAIRVEVPELGAVLQPMLKALKIKLEVKPLEFMHQFAVEMRDKMSADEDDGSPRVLS